MTLRQMLERLIRRRDPAADRKHAADRTASSNAIIGANRAVVDDLRRMEREVTGDRRRVSR